MLRTRAVAVGLATLAVSSALAGCAVEQTGGTYQSASGNGREASAPGVQVDDLTIVSSAAGTDGQAAFLGTVFNTTATEDELVAIVAEESGATLKPEPIPLPPGRGVAIQTGRDASAQFADLKAEPGTYVPVRMIFRNAGEVQVDALIVPPYGFYEEAAPSAATVTAEPQPSPSVTPPNEP